MPILHVQFSAPPPATNQPATPPTPQQVLQDGGPVVQVTIGIYQPIAQQLLQQGQSVPPPIAGFALMDTGASATCIDDAAAQHLNLPVVNVVRVASDSHASSQQNVYPISIDIQGLPVPVHIAGAIGAPLAAQGLLALIGRDVLKDGTLYYNGITGAITFAI